MSVEINLDSATGKMAEGIRAAFAASSLVAIAVGIAILAWPNKTAMAVAAILGIYAIVSGLFYVAVGIFVQGETGWARVGNILLGVLYVLSGIILFSNLSTSVEILQVVVGVMIGAVWLVEGVMALTTLAASPSKGLSVFYGVVSILAGLSLLFAPALYASVLWMLLGATILFLGIIQAVRAFTFGRATK